jgi:hypothetical protein
MRVRALDVGFVQVLQRRGLEVFLAVDELDA